MRLNDNHAPTTLAEVSKEKGNEMLRMMHTTLSQSSIENLEIDAPNQDNTREECIDIFDKDTNLLFRVYSHESGFWVENAREVGAALRYDEVVSLITATDSSEVFTKVFKLIK